MFTQYSSKLIIPLLTLQHAVRLRLAGTKVYHASNGGSANARRLEKLYNLIGDARVLFRIWGILPMIKWVRTREQYFFHRRLTDLAAAAPPPPRTPYSQ